jgi:hypothetical protein
MSDCGYSPCQPCGPMPRWSSPPANKTVKCEDLSDEDSGEGPSLEYSNNVTDPPECRIEGSASPTVTTNFGPCGGTITKVWEFEDSGCESDTAERKIKQVQKITVTYSDKANWINLPDDETRSCQGGQEYVQEGPKKLKYENHAEGEYDGCRVAGEATGYICAVVTPCDGKITQTWTADDDCRRILDHVQIITTDQAPAPEWVNPPQAETLNCLAAWLRAQQPPENFKLEYSNNLTGGCKIQGFAEPVITVNVHNCVGTITYNWDTKDPCGRPLTHTQVITVTPQ